MSENGKSTERAIPLDTVTLTYDRATDHMDVGGTFNSLDLALDMLARATRALEAKMRIAQAVELRATLADQARTQAILDSVKRGG